MQVAQWTAAPFSGVTDCSGPHLRTGQLRIPEDLRKQNEKHQPSISGDLGAQRQGWRVSCGGPPCIPAAPPLCSETPWWMPGVLWVCIWKPLPRILQRGKLRSGDLMFLWPVPTSCVQWGPLGWVSGLRQTRPTPWPDTLLQHLTPAHSTQPCSQ